MGRRATATALLSPGEDKQAPTRASMQPVEENPTILPLPHAGFGEERWSLAGKTALVTGGSKGIGRAIVEELAGFGVRVHTCGPAGVPAPVARRRLDILVNNAGQTFFMPATESTAEDYARLMATNLESCFHLAQLAHPLLLAASSGSVVNISSIAGFVSYPALSVYSATKGAMNQLTRSLAAEWAKDGVPVNCVAPGGVRTDITTSGGIKLDTELGRKLVETELERVPLHA